MSDSKPTTKRRPSLKIHHPHLRPAPLEACEACGVLFRFCEGCYAWGCKCGDPVSVCQSCHQATCGNCGTPYGFVTADDPPPIRAIAELAKHAGRVVDHEMTFALEEVEQWLSGFALDDEPAEPAEPEAEGWRREDLERLGEVAATLGGYKTTDVLRGIAALAEASKRSDHALKGLGVETEPEEVVGPVERVVLERLHPGGLGVALDAIVDVARAVDELAKRLDGGAR